MVVRKLEIPPPISSGPQLDSKFLLTGAGGTPVLECATKRQQFSSRLFLLRATMHACAKRTLYVSLGNRRCSSRFLPVPRTDCPARRPLGTISPNSNRRGDSASSPRRSGKEKKGEIIGSLKGKQSGAWLAHTRKAFHEWILRGPFLFRIAVAFRFGANCITIDTSSRFLPQFARTAKPNLSYFVYRNITRIVDDENIINEIISN